MIIQDILTNSLWCGLFACCMSILNSTPYKYIIPTFICGFTGIVVRDLLENAGLSANWATLFSAFMIVIIAGAVIRSKYIPPVVLICAILPQWATVAMFNFLNDLRKVSILSGEQLTNTTIQLTANFASLVIISLVIAIGFAIGIAVLKMIYRESQSDKITA